MDKIYNKINITVVIPSYNRAEKLDRALKSLTDQTLKEFKVIIIDDGSTDNTKEIVNSYQRKLKLDYIYSKNSGGPAKPRNIGLFKTNTKYIAFLDSDDWWVENKLEISLSILKKGYCFVYHDLYMHNNKFYSKNVLTTKTLKDHTYENLLNKGNIINNSSVVMESGLLKSIGGFDESPKLIGSEDYDAWIRLAKISSKFYKIPGIYGYYSLSNDSISSYQNCLKNNIYLRKKYNLCSKSNYRIGPAWLIYGYSRSLMLLGRYRSAQICAFLALRCKLAPIQKIKLLCIIFLSSIKILIKY